jgi:hypothetical protein
VNYRITEDDRARFKRCRRQWDFASPRRRGLEPLSAANPVLPAVLKDALAVYYYPGTWDWQPEMRQSLVRKAVVRAIDDAGAPELLPTATALVDAYDAWASTVDDFAPVRIGHDVQGLVPDPRDPERGLATPEGSAVIYACRIDLLAVDARDEYWVVRHQILDEWQDLEALIGDEAAVAACWAWEQEYLGMEISGTIHNQVRVTGPFDPPAVGTPAANRVHQSEPSGGGRAIPQHRRLVARTSRADQSGPVEQFTAGPLRRTRLRRGRAAVHVWPSSRGQTPNRCWRRIIDGIPRRITASRDWVSRRGASAEGRHHRSGNRERSITRFRCRNRLSSIFLRSGRSAR